MLAIFQYFRQTFCCYIDRLIVILLCAEEYHNPHLGFRFSNRDRTYAISVFRGQPISSSIIAFCIGYFQMLSLPERRSIHYLEGAIGLMKPRLIIHVAIISRQHFRLPQYFITICNFIRNSARNLHRVLFLSNMAELNPTELKWYTGNCHCGSFKFRVKSASLTRVLECNCSNCSRVSP